MCNTKDGGNNTSSSPPVLGNVFSNRAVACVSVFAFTLLYDVDVGDPNKVRVRARQNVSEEELDGKSRVSLPRLPSSVEWGTLTTFNLSLKE